MLKIMRHLRFLRLLMPSWHKKEKEIANSIRKELLELIPKMDPNEQRVRLKELENIKGYRQIKYQKAKPVLGEIL
jgi:indolepyruvate ferredoxin oxidoreductase